MSADFEFAHRTIVTSFVQPTNASKPYYSLLRHDCEFTDFDFVVGGKEFKVHRSILATQSPVFRKIFRTKERDASSNIGFIIASADTFSKMLDFMYTAKLPNTITLRDAFELLAIANKYEVDDLQKYCAKLLIGFARRCPDDSFHVYRACHYMKVSANILKAAFDVLNR